MFEKIVDQFYIHVLPFAIIVWIAIDIVAGWASPASIIVYTVLFGITWWIRTTIKKINRIKKGN
jgi:hypothetical protein